LPIAKEATVGGGALGFAATFDTREAVQVAVVVYLGRTRT
jgi:hypothetical protein